MAKQSDFSTLELRVPDVGDAESIELVVWNLNPGDPVEEGDELCELVTDKAAFPLESPSAGVLKEILVSEGSQVEIGQLLAILQLP